jgi:hypothetical protein
MDGGESMMASVKWSGNAWPGGYAHPDPERASEK